MKLRKCVPGTKVRIVSKSIRRVFPKVKKRTARIVSIDKKMDMPVYIKFKVRIHTATKSGRGMFVKPSEIEAV